MTFIFNSAETKDPTEKVLEELSFDGSGSGLEVEIDDDGSRIGAPFDPAKIDVFTQMKTVDLLLTRLMEGELDLAPDFQRRANLWSEAKKSSLIESLLLRIPIPSLYVSEDEMGDYAVVDGLQRLCAIAHFVNVSALNKAAGESLEPLRLSEMQSLNQYKNCVFGDLPRPLQRRIKETELTLHIIRASTPQEVKFNIFSRLNQGGLPLTAQEIRNAIYPGVWRDHIRRLAVSKTFRNATEGRIKAERMEDYELVLRFAAHYSLDDDENRPPDQNLDEFLNIFVSQRSAKWSDDRWFELERAFDRALIAATEIFGRLAFRKYSGINEARRPLNRGLFESETVALARLSENELALLEERKDLVIEMFGQYSEQNLEFINSLLYATGRGSSSNKRSEIFGRIFKEVLRA